MRFILPLLLYLLTAVNLNAAVDGNRIAEYSRNTLTGEVSLLREYIWLGARPLAVVENGETYFLTIDHIGRPVAAVDMSGAVAWRAGYAAFGAKTSGAGTDQRFAGQWFQEESGLHQNWMRDYDPTTGRYIQPDPLGLVDGPSVYGYALQNPVMLSDPTGLSVGSRIGDVCWEIRSPACAAANQALIWEIQHEMTTGCSASVMGTINTMLNIGSLAKGVFGSAPKAMQMATAGSKKVMTAGKGLTGKLKKSRVDRKGDGPDLKSQTSKTDGVKVMQSRGYRYMTDGEIQAVKETGLLRGGRPGETFFTKDVYRSSSKAQSRLALPTAPTHRVEFDILNDPKMIRNGSKVESQFGQLGGGAEFMTEELVRVRIINIQVLR